MLKAIIAGQCRRCLRRQPSPAPILTLLHDLLLVALVGLDLPLHEASSAVRMLERVLTAVAISDQVWIDVGLDATFLRIDPLLQYLLIHERPLPMIVHRLSQKL